MLTLVAAVQVSSNSPVKLLAGKIALQLGMLILVAAVQVSSNSPVKLVAGKIAHNSRSDQPPRVMAIGHDSLNQAVKVTFLDTNIVCMPSWSTMSLACSQACWLLWCFQMEPPSRHAAVCIVMLDWNFVWKQYNLPIQSAWMLLGEDAEALQVLENFCLS